MVNEDVGPAIAIRRDFGFEDDIEPVAACRAAGYAAACRTTGRGSWDDPFDLPRQDMNYGAGVLGLRLKRDDRYESTMRSPVAKGARRAVRTARETIRRVSRDRY